MICTALIPGKKAPLIIKENMFEKYASRFNVIYDLAAIQGGNTAFTEVDKINMREMKCKSNGSNQIY